MERPMERQILFLILHRDRHRHKEHVTNFVKKYPSAKGNVPKTLILVDPKDWAVSLEDPKANKTECCQVCSISEDIIRESSRRNELNRYCSCHRDWYSSNQPPLTTSFIQSYRSSI